MIKIVRHYQDLPASMNACIATIGNFDGMHLGHQALFARLRVLKSQYQHPIVVICFEPQPREYFSPSTAPARLSAFRDKVMALEEQGVDIMLCLAFDERFAKQTASDFVRVILHQSLKAQHLLVGHDFRFGYQREGDYKLLEAMAAELNFEVEQTSVVMQDDKVVSSTLIREKLQDKNFQAVTQLLGRPYRISGRVLHGEKLGREWGFPTLNLAWPFKQPGLRGIYAVNVLGLKPYPVSGAASIGSRPTVHGKGWNIEIHCLDFDEDCYGARVTIEFLKFFRDELQFDSIDELKTQIAEDVRQIDAYFKSETDKA